MFTCRYLHRTRSAAIPIPMGSSHSLHGHILRPEDRRVPRELIGVRWGLTIDPSRHRPNGPTFPEKCSKPFRRNADRLITSLHNLLYNYDVIVCFPLNMQKRQASGRMRYEPDRDDCPRCVVELPISGDRVPEHRCRILGDPRYE